MRYIRRHMNFIDELNKDVERLEKIASRFSSIGSVPHLKRENLTKVTRESISYLKKRLSSKIEFSITSFPNENLYAMINLDLFLALTLIPFFI